MLAYCAETNSTNANCPSTLVDSPTGVTLSAAMPVDTFLIQLKTSFASLFSSDSLSFVVMIMSDNPSNATVRLSQVQNGKYYYSNITSLVVRPQNASSEGTISASQASLGLQDVWKDPVRLQIDLHPAIASLTLNIVLSGNINTTVLNLFASNDLLLSSVFAVVTSYYALLPSKVRLRRLAVIPLLLSIAFALHPYASFLLQIWPPMNSSFSWIFVVSALFGTLVAAQLVSSRESGGE